MAAASLIYYTSYTLETSYFSGKLGAREGREKRRTKETEKERERERERERKGEREDRQREKNYYIKSSSNLNALLLILILIPIAKSGFLRHKMSFAISALNDTKLVTLISELPPSHCQGSDHKYLRKSLVV